MAPSKIVLDDDQRFALMKFRRNVHDILQPIHNDQFLLRWLKARNWNAEAAEKMLRTSMEWRRQWEVDSIIDWEAPEVIKNHYPSGVSGFDKDGAPVYIIPIAGLDIVGLIHSANRQDLIKFTIKILELNLALAAKEGGHQIIVIFDLDGFHLKPYAWRPSTELVISLLQMYEANYPETLKACYVINAPRVFAIAFNVIKRFLHENTLSKVQIYKAEPKKWKKILLSNIDEDNLPQYYGGSMVDPDGDPKCPSKIRPGGKVPKTYYTKKISGNPNLTAKKEYVSATIKKGSKLTLDFIVAEEGCFLKWDFHTENHDIKFGITCKDEDGKSHPTIRHRRVAAHQIEESGIISCMAPATYTVTFDNSYSLLRSKKIHYCVYVTEPLSKLDINTLPLMDEAPVDE